MHLGTFSQSARQRYLVQLDNRLNSFPVLLLRVRFHVSILCSASTTFDVSASNILSLPGTRF